MHRAGYDALGLPWAYVPFAMTSERLADALTGMRALGIRGFGVSMPFKIEILALLDRVDDLARQIGACNTVVNDAGALTGFNTDAEGAARALEESIVLPAKRCLVLGAGGAARAVAFGLVRRGAIVTLSARTDEAAASVARAIGAQVSPWSTSTTRDGGFDVLINATSVGMDRGAGSEACPVEAAAVRPGLVVMDIVYKPIETRLVSLARSCGATTIHGGRMLLHQAAHQFELYTGRSAPLPAMDEALRRTIGS